MNAENSYSFKFKFAGVDGIVIGNDVHWKGTVKAVDECESAIRYAIEMERLRHLGLPNTFRIYDNPRYEDRYTVLFMDSPIGRDAYEGLSMTTAGTVKDIESAPGFHLGRRISIADVPQACQDVIMDEFI